MEERNGGKTAEWSESSITPPVNNSEGALKKWSSAEAVCVSKTELSLISFPPSPSLICASAYLDGDGGARRGGDSSPLTDCKVWVSLEVQLFQRKTPSDQHGSIADRVAALRSASFTPPSTRSVQAPHRGPARRHPHPDSIATPCCATRNSRRL